MKRFDCGLVVGKFCPLHLGHEHMIETALSQCETVLLISYTKPEFPRCDPVERRNWFAQRFPPERFPGLRVLVLDDASLADACARRGLEAPPLPHNDDADELHRRFCGWVCRSLFDREVDAVFTSEEYGTGFAQSLSRQFGRDVLHVEVDRTRARVPISGTVLRRNLRAARPWLSREVYASFVPRVALLGGESSGKTTLAQAVAERLDVACVEEYGRELWVEQGGRLSYDDLLWVAEAQVERERRAALDSDNWVVCDTTPLTTLCYCLDDHGRAPERLHELAIRHYDLNVLCEPDFEFVQDGTRRDSAFRRRQHDWCLERLRRSDVRWISVSGSLEQRIETVLAQLRDIDAS